MGLFTALITLPLAPVRGTVWVAERLQEQAEQELVQADEVSIQQGLMEIEALRQEGSMDEAELEEAENTLIERLMSLRGFREEVRDGRVG
jgi:Gas vesicle protein G